MGQLQLYKYLIFITKFIEHLCLFYSFFERTLIIFLVILYLSKKGYEEIMLIF